MIIFCPLPVLAGSLHLILAMRRFDLFSFKKIVAQDFFETTLPGAWLSITATIVMGLLVVAELNAYLTPTVTSEVVMTT